MSSQHTPPSKEDSAHEAASELLMDAYKAIGGIFPPNIDSATAILIAAHALIAKLDSLETSMLDALRDLRESIDFHAAQSDIEMPHAEYNSELILVTLKASWLRLHPTHTEKDYREAMSRFEILAGL